MYTFVLEWTPALTPSSSSSSGGETALSKDKEETRATIPHGYIFAGFMVMSSEICNAVCFLVTLYTCCV